MTTAIDTNVLVALWSKDDALNVVAQRALDETRKGGSMVVNAAVYAELLAEPERDEAFVGRFCEDAGISVEWEVSEKMWREAAKAYQGYAARRRKERGAGPRRILTDFVIGAHAWVSGYQLLTLDDRLYRAAFPRLGVVKA
jgi:predicted nucleic acid-binding protein